MSKNVKYVAVLIVVLALVLTYNFNSSPAIPDLFTTNVDPINKTISEIENDSERDMAAPFLNNVLEQGQKWLANNFNVWSMYQNLANPSSRYIVLDSGLRKEEIAALLAKELKWTDEQKGAFLAMEQKLDKKNMEGRYNPGGYLVPNSAQPLTAYHAIMNKFNKEVAARYATSTAQVINIGTALKIASIIERESSGTSDMRLISGIIWNRIFKDMKLEMDATLQYAKGNSEDGWWPGVESEDKYIDSPYNTYQNKGLPPTPISNVSIAAIQAALNPKKTSCIFYIHDRRGNIHCSVTYKEHLANIKKYYGKK